MAFITNYPRLRTACAATWAILQVDSGDEEWLLEIAGRETKKALTEQRILPRQWQHLGPACLVTFWWQTSQAPPDSLSQSITQAVFREDRTRCAVQTVPGVRILPSPLRKAKNGLSEPGPGGRVFASFGRVRGKFGGKLDSNKQNEN